MKDLTQKIMAFTLIELLTVVAIIGLLVSLIIILKILHGSSW